MDSITPLFRDVCRKADFLFLLTEAYNRGFIPLSYALSMTEATTTQNPDSSRIRLCPQLRTLEGLRDAASWSRDMLKPYAPRKVGLDRKTERLLEIHENSHEL